MRYHCAADLLTFDMLSSSGDFPLFLWRHFLVGLMCNDTERPSYCRRGPGISPKITRRR